MIAGDRCTRACGFCAVSTAKPFALEADEPQRVAEATRRMGLKHVVITAVARDDLADGGAEHFRQTIEATRAANPGIVIEVLVPDFLADEACIDIVLAALETLLADGTQLGEAARESVAGVLIEAHKASSGTTKEEVAERKDCIRLLFWSGQSFEEPGLAPEGSFKAAEARFTDAERETILAELPDRRRLIRPEKGLGHNPPSRTAA